MKLSTLECSVVGCGREFHADLPMFHVELMAQDAGWGMDDDEFILCPEHNTPEGLAEIESWVVGCYTCGYEEDMSEDDARYEYKEHYCEPGSFEPDTYLRNPDELREKRRQIEEYQERRATERAHEEELARHSAERALLRQHQIEKWASNWLRIRNLIWFWKKEYIHEGHISTEDRQPAREDGSGGRDG